MNNKELRYFPLGGNFMKDKKVNDNIYGYLQTISYINDDKERFVYKNDVSPTKIQRYFEEREDVKISLSTIKRNLTLFKSDKLKLMVEGKTTYKGKEYDVFYLPQMNDEPFKLIPLETLKYLVDTSNGNVIKTYVYLLNKYGWKSDYEFTKGELIENIGFNPQSTSKGKGKVNYEMMDNILLCLKNNGLIDWVEYYGTTEDGKPTPKHKLTFVGVVVKGKEKKSKGIPNEIKLGEMGFKF